MDLIISKFGGGRRRVGIEMRREMAGLRRFLARRDTSGACRIRVSEAERDSFGSPFSSRPRNFHRRCVTIAPTEIMKPPTSASTSPESRASAANVVEKKRNIPKPPRSIRYPCACNSGNCNYVTKRKKQSIGRALRGRRTRETHNKREKARGQTRPRGIEGEGERERAREGCKRR